jgi:pantoate--beta-alanine ligase
LLKSHGWPRILPGIHAHPAAFSRMNPPIVLSTADAVRGWSREARRQGERVALVPTMGALHAGHLALVREARSRADKVVVSVFVNPTQFGPGEDFEAYPRTLESDLAALASDGCCDAVFAPPASEIYPDGENLTWVTVDRMGDHLCGASRPGHFRGVTTVVARLFAIAEPDVAVFGLKDAQQFFILRRMTREMGFGVELVGLPTVRETDGLALSSRNRYLDAAQREAAPALYRALSAARRQVESGEREAQTLLAGVRDALQGVPECRIDYVQLVSTADLQPIEQLAAGRQALLALAAWFGTARLIDNVILDTAG